MSVTIHWRPVTDKGRHFSGGTSSDLQVLKETFALGLSREDARVLRAMETATKNPFYGEVASVVEEVGAIEFWGEY